MTPEEIAQDRAVIAAALAEIDRLRGHLAQADRRGDNAATDRDAYKAEVEHLRAEAESDRGMYAAQLANVANERDNLRTALQNERSSPVWAIIGEVQAALRLPRGALLGEAVAAARSLAAGRRKAAQTLIAEIGAAGPENIEETAERAAAEIRRLNAELAKLGALKSAETAPVIGRLKEAFGADVPQAPSGKRADPFGRPMLGSAASLEARTAQATDEWIATHGIEALPMERARVVRRICYGGEPDFFMQEDGKPWTTIVRFCDASRPAEDPLTIPLSRYADGLEQVAAQAGCSVATADKLLRAVTAIRCAISGKPIDARIADALRELAFAICAVQARDPDQKAQLRRVAEAHDTLRYTLGDHNPDPTADDDANRSTLTEEQDEIASALKALGARPDLTLGEAIARFKARHALRTPLTNEQLDVLARAMPDVVDYERATPEQRRETVLEVLAIHGPRPARSALSDVDAENTARRLLAEMGIRDDAHVDRIARALQDVADGGRGHCDGSKRKAGINEEDAAADMRERAAQEAEHMVVEYASIDVLDKTPERLRIARRIRRLPLRGETGEPAKAPPVRHPHHDRHCMIYDGVGCSHEAGCEVEK